ncbi:MAG: amidohydrolase family protein, partial [Ktedonobacteraceae bacterium]|nr:amidohydrolase family protein [Ktedonobacteraceae bacterium]
LIEGERITAIDHSSKIDIPRDATVIDAGGNSVLPGLIDTHVHFGIEYPDILRNLITPPSLRLFEMIPRMRATLNAGVTTVRDAGGTPAGVKMAVERGIVAGPRMQVAVSLISQTGGHGDGHYPCCAEIGLFGLFHDVPDGVVDGVEEVRKKTREILRAGADWIKIATSGGVLSAADAPTSSQLTIDEISAAVYEAQAQEKRAMAHAQGTQGIKNALLAGIASIEHGIYLDDETLEIMHQRGVYLVPTLVAPLAVVRFAEEHPDILPPVMAAKAQNVIEAHQQSFRRAVEAGINIAMGTDSGVGRHGENGQELQLMVENGMTPMQAIVATTANAARLLHLDQQLGTLEVGKLADVVIVAGDVSSDISPLSDPANVQLVLKGGRAARNLLETRIPLIAGLE